MKPSTSSGSRRRVSAEDALALWREYKATGSVQVRNRLVMTYAPLVVHHYYPRYREIYARRGWTMFDYIDRVYDASKAMHRLGFVCRTGFGDILEQLDREDRGEKPKDRLASPGPLA